MEWHITAARLPCHPPTPEIWDKHSSQTDRQSPLVISRLTTLAEERSYRFFPARVGAGPSLANHSLRLAGQAATTLRQQVPLVFSVCTPLAQQSTQPEASMVMH